MSNMKLILELMANNSGMRNGLNTGRRDVHTFVAGAKKEFESLKGMATSLQGRLATLGIGVGVGKIVMDSARLDKSLTQIGQTAGESGKSIVQLRKELFTMGGTTGQSIENLQRGLDVLVQTGLPLKEAKAALEGVNIAMAVTSASSESLASGLSVAAKTFNFDLAKPGQALALLDKMTMAGRLGNAELGKISDIFSKVGQSAKAAGMNYEQTLAFAEGLSQVEMDPHRLGTLVDSTLRMFTNGNYMKTAQKATGIKFFDAKDARRDAFMVLKDIKTKYDTLGTDKKRFDFIQKAFGKSDLDTIRGLRTMLDGSKLSEALTFDKKIAAASGTLRKDFDEASHNLVDQTGRMGAKLREAADGFVTPINKALVEYMKFIMADKKDGGLGLDGKKMILGGGALIAGTAITARYGGKAIGGMADKLLKKGVSTAAGVAEGKALQYAAGVTPVFVVNADAIGGGTGKAVADAVATAGGGSAVKTAAGAAGASILIRAKELWGLATSPVAKGGSYLPMLATRAGFAGMAAGGGYMLGTGLNKGMGAVMGMGSNGRYKGDGALGEMFYDIIHRQGSYSLDRPGQQAKNDIKVEINFDEFLRPMIKTRNMNTTTSVNSMKRGSFMSPVENSVFDSGY